MQVGELKDLIKDIDDTKTVIVEIGKRRAEAFDVFNHPNHLYISSYDEG